MNWPPNKAWTSKYLHKGLRHFVAINYGGEGKNRWVNLVAVLDGEARFKISWSDLQDTSNWISGWENSDKNIDRGAQELIVKPQKINNSAQGSACLQPSDDCGLQIPSNKGDIRPWDYEDNKLS